MATFNITSANSVFSASSFAFASDSPSADTLNVAVDAFLVSGGFGGASLAGTGAWTAIIRGSVVSGQGHGIILESSSATTTITVEATGSVLGSLTGLRISAPVTVYNRGTIREYGGTDQSAAILVEGAGTHRITNSGTIQSELVAFSDRLGLGNDIITNTGTITGTLGFAGGTNSFTNSGLYGGFNIDFGNGSDTLTNTGILEVTLLSFGNGTNKLVNRGIIEQSGADIEIVFGNGSDSLINSGTIRDAESQGIGSAMRLGNGTNTFTNEATGVITGFGLVEGGSGRDKIINHGTFDSGAATGGFILGAGDDEVRNTGRMFVANVVMGEGSGVFFNSGMASVTTYSGATRADTITNSGTLEGTFLLGTGNDVFTNSGSFRGTVVAGVDAAASVRITNSGDFTGDAVLNIGKYSITNTGTWTGAIQGDTGNETIVNRGLIDGPVDLGGGTNRLTNSGRITGDVDGGDGVDTFVNHVSSGGVKTSGIVEGVISLGGGNDKFYGGDHAETVQDQSGTDLYELGGGNDVYHGFFFSGGTPDGVDTVRGGDGIDTYSALDVSGTSAGRVGINLDNVLHRVNPGSAGVAANTVVMTNSVGGANGTERVFDFENAIGTRFSDEIYGNARNNVLTGGGGMLDYLFGFAGNDTLDGGDGSDILTGGLGRDILIGGADSDVFVFDTLAETPVGGGRDLIMDFDPAEDLIALTGIDANTANGSSTNDAFHTFIGQNDTFEPNTPGTLRAVLTATGYIVEGNTDNDVAPEFQIEIYAPQFGIDWNLGLFAV